MKYLITSFALLLAVVVSAQNFIDKHYTHLEDLDRSTVVHVSSKSFDIASAILPENDEEAAEIKNFIATIHAVDVINVPEYSDATEEYKTAINRLESNFEELVNFKDKNGRFSLQIDAEDNIVYEVVAVGAHDGEFLVISVTGEMDLDMISKVIESIPMDDISIMRDFKGTESDEFKIYPNPAVAGTFINVQSPDQFEGGSIKIFDMSGVQVRDVSINADIREVDTQSLQPGTYNVMIEKDGVSLKKKVVIVK